MKHTFSVSGSAILVEDAGGSLVVDARIRIFKEVFQKFKEEYLFLFDIEVVVDDLDQYDRGAAKFRVSITRQASGLRLGAGARVTVSMNAEGGVRGAEGAGHRQLGRARGGQRRKKGLPHGVRGPGPAAGALQRGSIK